MLNNDAKKNIDLITSTAKYLWNENVSFGKLKVLNTPYPAFEWMMNLYKKIDILLIYDRSTLDIGILKNGKYVLVSRFTDKPFIRGIKSTQPENLLNNFRLLDYVVTSLI